MRVVQEFRRHAAEQRVLDLARRPAGREPGPVTDAENMRVNRERAFAEGDVQDDVRGLAADTRKRLELVPLARHLSVVLFDEPAGELDDIAGLGLPEAERADVLRD